MRNFPPFEMLKLIRDRIVTNVHDFDWVPSTMFPIQAHSGLL